ncbi:MAG: heavy metal sensor histidine kinase [Ignavibacteria bacterium]|nr:heavy metal sensor histidine kinase [Ignavibacteria bacterium]
MFETVKFTLRAKLTLMYGALIATTMVALAVIAYVTVSNELMTNLDASLSRASSSLLAVLKKEQMQARKPLLRSKPKTRGAKTAVREGLKLQILNEATKREFVGPLRSDDSSLIEDPVWSAVYEHMLLNSSNYILQVADNYGVVIWKSENLMSDSLPTIDVYVSEGARVSDNRLLSHYWLRGERHRIVMMRSDIASVTAAYPLSEIDATLRRLFAMMLYALPLVLFVSVVTGWFIAGKSLRPVDEITRLARQITARNLGQRLPKAQNNDEIGRLIETLNEMIERLEASFAQVKQFTSDASHELKTPLAILMGELEIALRRQMTADEYRATLTSCLEEVERLTHVVQGLLELSRAETGQSIIERKPVRISTLVADVCDDVLLIAETKGVQLTTDLQQDLQIIGDKVRLHQAILNVVENAVKYTPTGGAVRVEFRKVEDELRLFVSDTGIGIAPEHIPHLFDRFYRVDKARSKNIHGTGLGLAIVKWIVDVHHGTIKVVSSEGVGTTMQVTFPSAP